ncbi:MAG: aldehyde dehydrogenase [Clostridiales bacterium]|nr:aldehyde dehydrogenase [Clostridiales bacterium]
MVESVILDKISKQREFIKNNPVISVKDRKKALKRLHTNIKEMTPEICDALYKDLSKSKIESYMTEVGVVLNEISYMLRRVKRFARKKRVHTPLSHFPAKSYRLPTAYGSVLVISPWNYPFLLSIQPIVDAISAGNSVILKPSVYSPNVSAVIDKLIKNTFDEGYVTTVLGGVAECTLLLDQDFDYIFYTGSTRVGEIVMKKAAEHFTPVTLEMGGKSPCIVDKTANIKLAARRIVFGKLLNAGQTCVAPDYIYCEESVKDKLVAELQREIVKQYSSDPLSNKDYPKMINQKQFDAMNRLIDRDKVLYGGKCDNGTLKIEPTIVSATFDDEVMQNEIFGPILPILTFSDITEAVEKINKLTHPLALYIFSSSAKNQSYVLAHCRFGGGCINDTIMHLANNRLGFGGIKHSGIGAYHGKVGFETFTHYRSILHTATWLDLPLRYQPFTKFKEKLIKMFLK